MKLRYKITIALLTTYCVTAVVTFPWLSAYATAKRGYEAIGGEYMLPVSALFVTMIIADVIKTGKKDKEKELSKQRKGKLKQL